VGTDNARNIGTVIVTGGASGLGAAVVDAVANAGGIPVVLDRRAPRAAAHYVEVDLSDSKEAEEAVHRARWSRARAPMFQDRSSTHRPKRGNASSR